jgi:hypothetical protein
MGAEDQAVLGVILTGRAVQTELSNQAMRVSDLYIQLTSLRREAIGKSD